ncbi:UDP-3-O-(3-hydroxymyristoyl) glucosamine N-acyltransferase [Smithella sp. SC_K08D17]|jgi:UDP-3-O-[3-hydroxymyristoyl] N-acetylglucosamine deacetylase|nr:UDP-3-O-(3-hydroxymyristoyl) glucosamine N-acyltransferase [Smithella sp. D17]KIE17165.1 UDP-3-O-(3-hydroxymyristoyl) glucosamine N-acyltransferase [Smithella sp. SC_K08D17]MDD5524507.1 UDP-3-O-acyl-N-acetylglucosamine deacetylase [Smithella sp.]
MNLQRTLKKEINCFSIGLHTGRKINMKIKPAPADTGIVFIRKDLPEAMPILARYDNVCDTTLATTLGSNGVTVSTVEHLLSAFSGMGVDNAVVELDSFEVPVMDGSALPFVNMLKEVGTHVQKKNKKMLIIKKPVSVNNGDGSAMFMPADEFKITYEIDFKHPVIGKQSLDMTFSDEIYEKDICAAQTFGFLKDLEFLQARGLALGGSLKNAIVLDEKKIINKEGQRIENVFVKHKILDAIGDLFLLGMPIIGHFIAYKSGHRLNNLLLRELMAKKDCWEIVNSINKEEVHKLNFLKKIPSFKILDAIRA